MHSARTLALLQAPVLPTLLRLALPNVLVMLAQSPTGLIEAAFVGRLGTAALAGMALVFPGVMLMQMVSSGAMGGGISSAIARALGAGRLAWPLAAAVLRMAVAVGGGWLALRLTGSLTLVHLALGAGLLTMGVVNAAAVAAGTWFEKGTA